MVKKNYYTYTFLIHIKLLEELEMLKNKTGIPISRLINYMIYYYLTHVLKKKIDIDEFERMEVK